MAKAKATGGDRTTARSKPAAKRKTTATVKATKPKRARSTAVPAARGATAAARDLPAATDAMATAVLAAVRLRNLDDSPDVVATIAAVGRGYRSGPASIPRFLTLAFDADQAVADALVERFGDGTPPAGVDRDARRRNARATVDMNLAQAGVAAGDAARTTLTSLVLGTWDPDADEKARVNAIAGFLVPFYRAGLR